MPRPKSFSTKLREPVGDEFVQRVWKISQGKDLDAIGECDWTHRTIRFDPGFTSEQIRNTLIHEAIHVTLPSLDEEHVLAAEANIAAILKIADEILKVRL